MKVFAVALASCLAGAEAASLGGDAVELAGLKTAIHMPSPRDLVRAQLARPATDSHVHGQTAQEAFAKMNKFLDGMSVRNQACEDMSLEALNDITRILHGMRRPALDASYRLRNDRRKLHYDDLTYKEALWEEEDKLIKSMSITKDEIESIRGGKCAENVMMFIHHLTESQQEGLAKITNFMLPYMPRDVSPEEARAPEYEQQIGCTSCHLPVHVPGKPPISPIPNKTHAGPQYPEFCPINNRTGLPTVWYNRQKRCDWDYEPFCQPCEGIGGMVWGTQEHEWLEMPCSVVATPDQVPVGERVVPLWPKDFSVDEIATLTFPGRDPCVVNLKNSTYTLNFQTTPSGPIYHTVGHTGPSGPIPTPGKSWAFPSGNFWNTVEAGQKDGYCVCLGSLDPSRDNAFAGPLTFDFNIDAKYIGRERIVPEYLNAEYIADHYVKGPHHFWYDVKTGLMLREYQPFNGRQTYFNWKVGVPSPEIMRLPEICTKGLLHLNVSCKAPVDHI